jgi:hypothetical protein
MVCGCLENIPVAALLVSEAEMSEIYDLLSGGSDK